MIKNVISTINGVRLSVLINVMAFIESIRRITPFLSERILFLSARYTELTIPSEEYEARAFLFVSIPSSLIPGLKNESMETAVAEINDTRNTAFNTFSIFPSLPEKNEKKKKRASPERHILLVNVPRFEFMISPSKRYANNTMNETGITENLKLQNTPDIINRTMAIPINP